MRRLLALATFFVALLTALPAAAQEWEFRYEKDAVKVSSKDVPGSKLVAFKGETVYDEPIGRVLWVLLDNPHRVEWVDMLYTNEVIDRKSDFDYVIYQAFKLPALFADRDYVYHGVATRDDKGVVTLKMQSVEHAKAPETVGVRAELVNSLYRLTPLEDGQKTKIEVEIMTDPKGWMPAWLVNMVQKDWPLETLNGIRGQFKKDHMSTHLLPGEAEEKAAAEKAAAEAAAAEAAAAEGANEDGAEGAGEAVETEGTEAPPAETPPAPK